MDIRLELIEKITDKFSEEHEVGTGGYGTVYRGMYEGEEIAFKKLHPFQGLDDKAFDNEFRLLKDIHHKNIVRLIGYCYEMRRKFIVHNGNLLGAQEMQRVLCFEYMQGGSLDKHIGDKSCDLDWSTCYEIIKGTSVCLNHLHSAQGGPIYHLDLKPSNILLDKNMTPKIADLGLSRLVSSTETHKTEIAKGTHGYMPPEYVDGNFRSKKFDVFSLGVIILKIMTGNKSYYRCYEMSRAEFMEFVIENWERRLQGISRYSSYEKDILQMKKCVDIALKCVEKDRNKRPCIKDIVHELEELDAKIKETLLSRDLIGQTSRPLQTSSDTNALAVDPTMELRFIFELRKDISTCLQLTNKTDGFVAFRAKTNQTKYCTRPNKGIIPPCSRCYIAVTLRAQDEAPLNMQCNDMFLVQSAQVSEDLTSDGITDDLFGDKVMPGTVVDIMRLPIVYVAWDQFP